MILAIAFMLYIVLAASIGLLAVVMFMDVWDCVSWVVIRTPKIIKRIRRFIAFYICDTIKNVRARYHREAERVATKIIYPRG